VTKSVCSEPGCKTLDCTTHRANRMRAYNQRRRATFDVYNTTTWRRISKRYLAQHPTCWCGAKATVTDHRIPRPRGAPLDLERWDREGNLQALCAHHHASKTMTETNARGGIRFG
jgi:hypothetical protein